MSSRTSIQQIVSATEPVGAAIGDEWLNTTNNSLYKRTIVNGVVVWANVGILPTTSTTSTQVLTVSSTGTIALIDPVTITDYNTPSAQYAVSGGGTVVWNGSSIKWSARVIAIPIKNPELGISGYADITCPTSGIIQYYSSGNSLVTATCDANGIPLGAWQALWYQLGPAQASGTDQTRFRLVDYGNTKWIPTVGWILIAVRNGDGVDGHVKWLPGQINFPNSGGTYVSGTSAASWSTGYLGSGGYTGSQGIQGVTGFVGSRGYDGSRGFTGYDGSRGFTGSQGIQGITGFTGSQGIQGIIGYTGSQGIQGIIGYTGSQGIQGITGFVGSRGYDGSRGFTGYDGSRGFTGSQGIQGITGFTGSQGIQGIIGFTGSQGIQGVTGFVGSQGIGYVGSAGSSTYSRITSNTTVIVGSRIIADTAAGAFTLTLPALPATGATVEIVDGANWATNNLTIGRNGQTIEGAAADLVLSTGGVKVDLVFDGTTWEVYTNSIGVIVSDSAPGSPVDGALWWDSTIGQLRVYYNDGTSSQWVDAINAQGIQGNIGYVGSTGYTGSASTIIGYTGSTGSQGVIGYVGSFGYTGSASTIIGYTGSTGSQGVIGYIGSFGYTGSASTTIGYTGSKGTDGASGVTTGKAIAMAIVFG